MTTQENGWIGEKVVKNIRVTKQESETRRKKLKKSLPGLVGYGITHGSSERIAVICEEITPEIRSMFREGIRGQPVKFVEVGHIIALDDRTSEYRPLVGGVSVGHYAVSAGTIGSVVYDNTDNAPLILSNAHVLANSDTPTEDLALVGDDIFQPGKYDTGTEVVAQLYNWIPLVDGVTVDAALASPTAEVSNYIIDIPKITGTTDPEISMRVQKSGRTTGFTEGEVIAVDATIDVEYDTEIITLDDQFITTYMSDPGDSGSIVLTLDGEVVGLLFAGSDKATVYNRIENVMDLLNIHFENYGTEEVVDDDAAYVMGFVVDGLTGDLVTGASVIVEGVETFTDDVGAFEFEPMAPDTYFIVARASGYRAYTDYIDMTNAGNYDLQIELVSSEPTDISSDIVRGVAVAVGAGAILEMIR